MGLTKNTFKRFYLMHKGVTFFLYFKPQPVKCIIKLASLEKPIDNDILVSIGSSRKALFSDFSLKYQFMDKIQTVGHFIEDITFIVLVGSIFFFFYTRSKQKKQRKKKDLKTSRTLFIYVLAYASVIHTFSTKEDKIIIS